MTTTFNPTDSTTTSPQVLITGAGPTGMVLALWLAKQGTAVRIIDKTPTTGTQSRALALQARTLELYRQMGLADTVVADGFRSKGVNIWSHGKRRANFLMQDIATGLSPYPFILVYPQDKHEKLLEQTLAEHGITVERNTELVSFVDNGDSVTSQIRHADGSQETLTTRFLAGCDGARSLVRHSLNADFDGGTYKQLFYVADVEVNSDKFDGQINIAFEESDFLLVMPYDDCGKVRFIGTVQPDKINKTADTLTFDDVGHLTIDSLGIQVERVNWFSTYHVHHRVTTHFRHGNAFLLGDAAHIHSPAGGQGMNTGIADAINLSWKLTAVLNQHAPDSLLDTIESERASFAHSLVKTTDKVFEFATAEGDIADFVRTYLAPNMIKLGWHFDIAKEKVFELVSQIKLNYRNSPLSVGVAVGIHGGDRLPYAVIGDKDNLSDFDGCHWQVQVYGEANADLVAWCERQGIKLISFAWQANFEKLGFAKNAAYLLRPDSYVAVAVPNGAVQVFQDYAEKQALTF